MRRSDAPTFSDRSHRRWPRHSSRLMSEPRETHCKRGIVTNVMPIELICQLTRPLGVSDAEGAGMSNFHCRMVQSAALRVSASSAEVCHRESVLVQAGLSASVLDVGAVLPATKAIPQRSGPSCLSANRSASVSRLPCHEAHSSMNQVHWMGSGRSWHMSWASAGESRCRASIASRARSRQFSRCGAPSHNCLGVWLSGTTVPVVRSSIDMEASRRFPNRCEASSRRCRLDHERRMKKADTSRRRPL